MRRALLVLLVALGSLAGWAAPASAAPAAGKAYVRVNQVGFTAAEPRRALLMSTAPLAGRRFSVVRRGGDVVANGSVGHRVGRWSARFPYVYSLDLSLLELPGTYLFRVTGAGRQTVRLAPGRALYRRLLANAVAYYRSVRDGPDVIPGRLHRKPAHLRDRTAPVYAKPRYNSDGELQGKLERLTGTHDVSGGWFDAGDYVKFVHNTAYATTVMLLAARDHAAAFPASAGLAAEARFGVDWLLRMWDDSTRTLYFQVGIGDGNGDSILGDHDFWRLPQADDRLRAGRTQATDRRSRSRRNCKD